MNHGALSMDRVSLCYSIDTTRGWGVTIFLSSNTWSRTWPPPACVVEVKPVVPLAVASCTFAVFDWSLVVFDFTCVDCCRMVCTWCKYIVGPEVLGTHCTPLPTRCTPPPPLVASPHDSLHFLTSLRNEFPDIPFRIARCIFLCRGVAARPCHEELAVPTVLDDMFIYTT